MATVYLGLGSNLGDRWANLQRARQALAVALRPRAVSPIYETPPWGFTEQPSFLNQVICAETDLSPGELLRTLKQIEARLGRQDGPRYGPRLIDVDILFYDDLVLESPQLTIPHPRLDERAFILTPLADLAPDLRHPQLGLSVKEMLGKLDRSGIVLVGIP